MFTQRLSTLKNELVQEQGKAATAGTSLGSRVGLAPLGTILGGIGFVHLLQKATVGPRCWVPLTDRPVEKFNRANAMTTHYHFDATQSHMTVQAFSSGLLSFLGHNPTFTVHDLSGTVSVPDDILEGLELVLTVPADSLEVISDLKPAERREITDRTRSEVLETVMFPTISFHASTAAMLRVNPGQYRVKLDGSLTLHGVVRHHRVELEMLHSNSIRFVGETHLHISDYLIRPVTALGGTLRLKDAVKLTFDLVALPESGLDHPAEQFSEGGLSHAGIDGNG